jgi:hypothetical protein
MPWRSLPKLSILGLQNKLMTLRRFSSEEEHVDEEEQLDEEDKANEEEVFDENEVRERLDHLRRELESIERWKRDKERFGDGFVFPRPRYIKEG